MIIRFLKIRKLKRLYKFDYVLSFLESPNILNILTRQKEKVIVSVREYKSNNDLPKMYFSIYKFLIKRLYNKANKVITVAEGVKIDLIRNFNVKEDKIDTIFNMFNIQDYNKFKQEKLDDHEYKLFDENKIIINVGRLTYLKAQWLLLKLYRNLIDKNTKHKLVFLGDGDLRELIIESSKKMGLKTYNIWENNEINLDADVFFLGFKKNPFKYIYNSDIFILSSISEGFPNSLVEAMICNLPIISSDCGTGSREILAPELDLSQNINNFYEGKYGILLPTEKNRNYCEYKSLTETEEIWLEYLKKFINDEDKQKKYAELSYQRAKDFSSEKIINQWKSILS